MCFLYPAVGVDDPGPPDNTWQGGSGVALEVDAAVSEGQNKCFKKK
jgi:hypothetical protein